MQKYMRAKFVLKHHENFSNHQPYFGIDYDCWCSHFGIDEAPQAHDPRNGCDQVQLVGCSLGVLQPTNKTLPRLLIGWHPLFQVIESIPKIDEGGLERNEDLGVQVQHVP